jgi:hypothetical protein
MNPARRQPLRSPLPSPQAETEAPAVEATLLEASIVEGEYTAQTQSSSRSSCGRRGRLIHMSSVDRV